MCIPCSAVKTVKLPLVHPLKSAELDKSKEKTRQDNALNGCSNLKDECHTLHDGKNQIYTLAEGSRSSMHTTDVDLN